MHKTKTGKNPKTASQRDAKTQAANQLSQPRRVAAEQLVQ